MTTLKKAINILIIGGGGRELSIAWKLKQSALVRSIFLAPGNAGVWGIGEIAMHDGKPIKADDIPALIRFAKANNIGLTIVGPEGPLCAGIVDRFREKKLRIFGPTQAATQLEGSKLFAKQVMIKCGVPTAAYETFNNYAAALAYVEKHFTDHPGIKLVIKADGLAGGKGVIICENVDQANAALKSLMLDKAFNGAGTTVVIEEFLEGHEFSFMALYDGTSIKLMIPSQDHKQRYEGDTGPMTGGMGAFAPVPWVTDTMINEFVDQSILPMLKHLEEQHGIVYTGCLYIALMYTADGLKILEWNARFGDPETQAVFALMEPGLLEYLLACTDGTLGELPPMEWHDQHAVCVALCEDPYPDKPKGGYKITGIEEAVQIDGVTLIYAGVGKDVNGKLITAGGRVLYVICVADSLKAAQQGANEAAARIKFDGAFFRNDIGSRPAPTFV